MSLSELMMLGAIAINHLLIGGCLLLAFHGLFRFLKINPKMQSWYWIAAMIISSTMPLTLSQSVQMSENSVSRKIVRKIEINLNKTTSLPVNEIDKIVDNIAGNMGLNDRLEMSDRQQLIVGQVLYGIFLLWLIGAALRARNLLQCFKQSEKIARHAFHPQELFEFKGKQTLNAIQTPFKIAFGISSPLVIGLFNPIIVIPDKIARQFKTEQLQAIIYHEQAHIERNDLWLELLQELLMILFWWSPVSRLINKRIHISREMACDQQACNRLSDGRLYAQSLLDCAKLMIDKGDNVLSMAFFSKKSELTARINSVLQQEKTGKRNALTVLTCGLGIIYMSLLGADSLTPTIQSDRQDYNSQKHSLFSGAEGEGLIRMIKQNDIVAIRQQLREGLNINRPIIGDGTLLMLAVAYNQKEMINFLLEAGADVNQSSLGDGNPLIIAAKRNNMMVAKLLIDKGADINASVARDETPLINASRYGHLEMTKLLVEQGADVNLSVSTGYSDDFERRSPLNMANNSEIKRYLIEHGAQ